MRALAVPCLAISVGLLLSGCARTDAEHYRARDDARAVFSNGMSETFYLAGCAPFVFERSLEGEWTEQGPPFECVWEGFALPVEPGTSVATDFRAPDDTGLYRLRYEAGARCEPDQPLSQAHCGALFIVHTNIFEVERELCEPSEPGCQHVPAAPNHLCEDGVHYGGPSAECTRDPSSGRCGYEFLRCP